jgi:hypothetical protein
MFPNCLKTRKCSFRTFALILTLTFFGASCARELSDEGRMVREIQADWANSCEFLGVLEESEGNGWDIPDDRRGALNRVRHSVAQIGGNAFVITSMSSNGFRTLVQADSYYCP